MHFFIEQFLLGKMNLDLLEEDNHSKKNGRGNYR